jgi:hypothetical protein
VGQRQDSLTGQMETVRKLAVAAGCYDAEIWIRDRFPPAEADLPSEGEKTVMLGAWQLTGGEYIVMARTLRVNSVRRANDLIVLNVLDGNAGEEYSVDFKPSDDVRVIA